MRDGSSDSAIILAHLALRFAERIERPSKTFDWWGWAYRDIRGSSQVSNHASATAVDLNATQHPLGDSGTFTAKQVKQIRRDLRKVYKGTIRWGGDYNGRKDEMHFEMQPDQRKAAKVAKRLRRSYRGKRILKANGFKVNRILKAIIK